MRYLHTMVRVKNLDAALEFWCGGLGLRETRRVDNEKGRFTLVFLSADEDADLATGRDGLRPQAEVELTFDPPWTRDMMSEAAQLQAGFM